MVNKKKDSYLYEPSASKHMNPEDGSYQYAEPEDYDEYLELINNGEATERHNDEFDLRMIWHFIEQSGKNGQPKRWVVEAIAEKLLKITQGGRWEDEFRLPWTKYSLPRSPAENKALQIYLDVRSNISKFPDQNITDIFRMVAEDRHVSYETASADYYKHKKRFTK